MGIPLPIASTLHFANVKMSWKIQRIDNRKSNPAKIFDLYLTDHPHEKPPLIHLLKNKHNRLHPIKKERPYSFCSV
jgi:hypothetical protein